MQSIELSPVKVSTDILQELEARKLIKMLAAPDEILSAKEGESRFTEIYVSAKESGPHKLIAIACNRTDIPLSVHDENEEFILFSGTNLSCKDFKPLYLVIALDNLDNLQKKIRGGRLQPDDFVMLELVFDDPKLSIFTMLKGTVHTELTAVGPGQPPVFFVTESRDISNEIIDLSPYGLTAKAFV